MLGFSRMIGFLCVFAGTNLSYAQTATTKTCPDGANTCTVNMGTVTGGKSKKVSVTFEAIPKLTININGIGSVSVSPESSGLTCVSTSATVRKTCILIVDNAPTVELSASPSGGNDRATWSGPCTASPPPSLKCSGLKMDKDQTVNVTFAKPVAPSTFKLTSVKNSIGGGTGRVRSNQGKIDHGWVDSDSFVERSLVALTATPDIGSILKSWSGCDQVSGNVCSVTMDRARAVTSTYEKSTTVTYRLTVSITGSGGQDLNKVTISPPSLNCSPHCSHEYNPQQNVVLTAIPHEQWTFKQWGGECNYSTNTVCNLTMNRSKSVDALFIVKPKPPGVCVALNERSCAYSWDCCGNAGGNIVCDNQTATCKANVSVTTTRTTSGTQVTTTTRPTTSPTCAATWTSCSFDSNCCSGLTCQTDTRGGGGRVCLPPSQTTTRPTQSTQVITTTTRPQGQTSTTRITCVEDYYSGCGWTTPCCNRSGNLECKSDGYCRDRNGN